ncbi:MAG: serpin family protein [Candidatus Omnitrophica bacterium]|nr:serpin family protein [Candidatus Omnitrophota bacterium]
MKPEYIRVSIIVMLFLLLSVTAAIINNSNAEEIKTLAEENNSFALDLYGKLKTEEGNIFFSPFSISSALAMTYAGARGNTAFQMADVLHVDMSRKDLHVAFSKLIQDLYAAPEEDGYELSVANALWSQSGYDFHEDYTDIIKDYYKAGFEEVDFANNTETARQIINRWVEDKTHYKIKDLIKQGMLTSLTKLVLTNAIYFKGTWMFQFDRENTQALPFTLISGEKVRTPMMHQTADLNYSDSGEYQILEIPYTGDKLSMIVFLPEDASDLIKFEDAFTSKNIKNWILSLRKQKVEIFMPKFRIISEFKLSETLKKLGMIDAFSDVSADFSGMTSDSDRLYISDVIHKAFVDVNEKGTEAAAATAVGMRTLSAPMPKPVFRVDHPFIFIIRDIKSSSILFIGKVVDPR